MVKRGECDAYGTPPMFAIEPGAEGERLEKPKPPKTVAHGTCPMCGDWAALYSATGHLVWKYHSRPTWGAARFPCMASGLQLCEMPCASQMDHDGHDVTPSCNHPQSITRKA